MIHAGAGTGTLKVLGDCVARESASQRAHDLKGLEPTDVRRGWAPAAPKPLGRGSRSLS